MDMLLDYSDMVNPLLKTNGSGAGGGGGGGGETEGQILLEGSYSVTE